MVLDAPLVLDTLCLAIYSNTSDTMRIVTAVVELYGEAVKKGDIFNDDSCKLYIDILKEISEHDLDTENESELSALLLKFETNPTVKEDPNIIKRLNTVVENRANISRGRIRILKNRINKTVMVIKGGQNLKKLFNASNRIMTSTDSNKQDALYLELIDKSRELSKIYEDRFADDSVSIDHIDMTCTDSVRRALSSFKTKRANRGYKLGLQQFEKMFGSAQGPVPGECVGIAALSYHFKSGMLMAFARWMAQYNIPKKQTDKPAAIVFISLENEIHENMMMWFKDAYVNTFHKDPAALSNDEIISTIVQLYMKNGFTLLVDREDTDSFGWEQWKAKHEKYSEKYEIVASYTDYMGIMHLPENGLLPSKNLQNLTGYIKNYGARHNMCTFTGLQLNGLAEELDKSGKRNVVQQLGAAHLADAKAIKRELDVLIFLYIETNHLGVSFLTAWLDKHKYNKMPPACDRYAAIPFSKDGLLDDIYGDSSHVPDIYNMTQDSSTDSASTDLF